MDWPEPIGVHANHTWRVLMCELKAPGMIAHSAFHELFMMAPISLPSLIVFPTRTFKQSVDSKFVMELTLA